MPAATFPESDRGRKDGVGGRKDASSLNSCIGWGCFLSARLLMPQTGKDAPMPFSMSRYRCLKFLIPLFLAFYLFMVWLKPVIGVTHDEIFPFFSWRLFSGTPGWYAYENALIVHS